VSLNSGAGKQAAVKLKGQGGLCYISLDKSAAGQAAFKKFLPAGSIVSLKQNKNINGLQKYGANIMQIPWVMLTNAKESNDLVYKVTKKIAESQDELKKSFVAFGRAKRANMAPANLVPYHPGALKYYKEAGIKVGK